MNKENIKPQIAIVNNYTLIAVLYTLFFSVLFYYSDQKIFLSAVHLFGLIAFIINYLLLHYTKNFERASHFFLSIGTILVVSLFATDGYENTGHFWIYAYLPFIFFQAKNIKNALLWTSVLYAGLLFITILNFWGLITLPYSTPFIVNYFASLITLTVLYFWFQNARNKHEDFLSYTRSLIETSGDPFIIINADGKIMDINQVTLDLTGLSRSQLIDAHFSSVFTDAGKTQEAFSQFLSSGFIHNVPLSISNLAGKTTEVLVSATEYKTGSGKMKGGFISLRDVTERVETEKKIRDQVEKLGRTNEQLDQFAYIVSHDLRAPLRAIKNLTEWIKEDLGSNLSEENKKNMTLLESRVNRMDALINGILEYSKIGRIKVAEETVNVNKLLAEIVDLLSPPSTFNVNIEPGMPVLTTEKILLQQVFANLINNAIKYNDKEKGEINVSAKELEQFYEFTIADNGPGIAPEHHHKIFGIFQTLEARDKVESTGIGLSIVKKIIDEHGGKIWIDSAKGSGAKFIFTWPKKAEKNQ